MPNITLSKSGLLLCNTIIKWRIDWQSFAEMQFSCARAARTEHCATAAYSINALNKTKLYAMHYARQQKSISIVDRSISSDADADRLNDADCDLVSCDRPNRQSSVSVHQSSENVRLLYDYIVKGYSDVNHDSNVVTLTNHRNQDSFKMCSAKCLLQNVSLKMSSAKLLSQSAKIKSDTELEKHGDQEMLDDLEHSSPDVRRNNCETSNSMQLTLLQQLADSVSPNEEFVKLDKIDVKFINNGLIVSQKTDGRCNHEVDTPEMGSNLKRHHHGSGPSVRENLNEGRKRVRGSLEKSEDNLCQSHCSKSGVCDQDTMTDKTDCTQGINHKLQRSHCACRKKQHYKINKTASKRHLMESQQNYSGLALNVSDKFTFRKTGHFEDVYNMGMVCTCGSNYTRAPLNSFCTAVNADNSSVSVHNYGSNVSAVGDVLSDVEVDVECQKENTTVSFVANEIQSTNRPVKKKASKITNLSKMNRKFEPTVSRRHGHGVIYKVHKTIAENADAVLASCHGNKHNLNSTILEDIIPLNNANVSARQVREKESGTLFRRMSSDGIWDSIYAKYQ